MMSYTTQRYSKPPILSLLTSLGVIVFIAGIFIESIQVTRALFVAICFWMMAGVISRYMGVNSKGVAINTNWKHALGRLLSSIGVLFLLSGPFLGTSVDFAIGGAIIFWIISAIISNVLGLNSKDFRIYNNSYQNRYSRPESLSTNQNTSSLFQNSNQSSGEPSLKASIPSTYSKKAICSHCSAPMDVQDTFCSNCGSSNTKV